MTTMTANELAQRRLHNDAQKRYNKTPEGRETCRNATAKYRDKNPLKIWARQQVYNALRRGEIKKEPCSKCGADKAHAHHGDYTKPLDIEWLCAKCHTVHHEEQGK